MALSGLGRVELGARIEELEVLYTGHTCVELLKNIPNLRQLIIREAIRFWYQMPPPPTGPPPSFPFALISLVTPLGFDPSLFHSPIINSTSSFKNLAADVSHLNHSVAPEPESRFAERRLVPLVSLSSLGINFDRYDTCYDPPSETDNLVTFLHSCPSLRYIRAVFQHNLDHRGAIPLDLLLRLPPTLVHLDMEDAAIKRKRILVYLEGSTSGLRWLSLDRFRKWKRKKRTMVEEAGREKGMSAIWTHEQELYYAQEGY